MTDAKDFNPKARQHRIQRISKINAKFNHKFTIFAEIFLF
ncbi:hypothetical protein J504_1379 [Acinetobacter baumannii 348935]|nr:hypothetical protein J504_1379 [Acinetobacter baumannii 348935]